MKNNYLLSLISDVIKNIGTKRVFTKMDLRWGYNNVWIKEEDEWKVVFMIPEEVFESTVILFRLTNFSVMFQMMMNEILWDFINTRKVASFINNIVIEIEEEKGYNKIVEEVVKRLVKNDLYMKQEKYKLSKLKAVDFNYFYFYFYFYLVSFILFLELGLGLVMTSLGHTLVTSYNTVTVTVSSHMM